MAVCKPVCHETMRFEDLLFHILDRKRSVIYRGCSSSRYKLYPYALRKDGRRILEHMADGYLRYCGSPVNDQTFEQQDLERLSIMWFHDLANQNGIDVPDIPCNHLGDPWMELKATRGLERWVWPLDGWLEMAALAQHYGVPTRLLDWSFSMETAAFFATRSLPDRIPRRDLDKSVSIWELDKSKLSLLTNDFRFVVPGYSRNPNILAQKGILSVYVGAGPEIVPIEGIISHVCKDEPASSHLCKDGPILRKIDIPYPDALRLKQHIESEGLHHEKVFPGLSDIATSMKELSGIRRRCTVRCRYSTDAVGSSSQRNETAPAWIIIQPSLCAIIGWDAVQHHISILNLASESLLH